MVTGYFVPISDCEVRDPRIRRTRQLLQGALRTLMQKKSFDEISVQDLADEATVNRATFYDHYTDKFDLLEALVAGGFHQLLHERSVRYDGSCASAARPIILAACDYGAMHQGSCPEVAQKSAFEPLIDAAITNAIRRVMLEGISKMPVASGPSAEMVATTASWAIYGAVKEWLKTPNRLPAEEIVTIILPLVLPILQAVQPSKPPEAEVVEPANA
jgi:AcrR family transcriptional regulator